MVDQEVNLPEKSGVVTAEMIFTLWTNSFGSENSWRLSLTDYTDYTDLIFLITSTFFSHRLHRFDFWLVYSAVMSHMRHKSYLSGESYQGANDSWLLDYTDLIFDWSTVPSWVICATKVISQGKVIKAQMTPDFYGWPGGQPSGVFVSRDINC